MSTKKMLFLSAVLAVALSFMMVGCVEKSTGESNNVKLTIVNADTAKGTVKVESPTTGQLSFKPGTDVTVRATAKDGYLFAGWGLGDSTYTDTLFTFKINENVTLTANFGKEWLLTIVQPGAAEGTVRPIPPGVSKPTGKRGYAEGTKVTVTAEPKLGYVFTGWIATPSSLESDKDTLSFEITSDVTLEAVIERAFSVIGTANPTAGGKVTLTPNKTGYLEGAEVVAKAVPNAGYAFVGWTADADEVDVVDTMKITVSGDVTVTAYFERAYKLPIETFPKSAGTAVASNSGGPYTQGTRVNVTAVATNDDYEFKSWTLLGASAATTIVDVSSASTRITVGPDTGLQLIANFKQKGEVSGGTPIIDSRGSTNEEYKIVKIGDYVWMAENLNFTTPTGSWCYDGEDANCATYGRLYTWEAAKTACPSGWHLPDRDEWSHLRRVVGDDVDLDEVYYALLSKNGWSSSGNRGGDDLYGFKALPGGKREGTAFAGALTQAYWWSATASLDEPSKARSRHIAYQGEESALADEITDKANGYSVRCVQDAK